MRLTMIKIIQSVGLLLMLLSMAGCLDFGDDWNTTTPTTEQRQASLRFVKLDPNDTTLKILGVKYIGSGIDNAIWLKLQVANDTDFLQKYPATPIITTQHEKPDYKEAWWALGSATNVATYQYAVTTHRLAYVWIQQHDDGQVVYIQSNER